MDEKYEISSYYDINTINLPEGASYGIRKVYVYNGHIAIVVLYDLSGSIFTCVYNNNWSNWVIH